MQEINEDLVKTTIDLEKVFFELFGELKLKPAQCQLIRAFLIISNGKNEFEASFTDLANVLYKTKGYDKKGYNNARNAVKALKKWQQKHEITLVELLETGSKVNDIIKGKTEYKKSKYRFAALGKIAEAYSENPADLKAIVKSAVEELKKDFVPAEPKKKYQPNRLIKDAKKTIYTKLGRIFELAIQLGEEPYNLCKPILDDCLDILNHLDSKYKVHKNRDSFITKFEREYGLSVIDDNQEKDVAE
jgi:hypothetical protein